MHPLRDQNCATCYFAPENWLPMMDRAGDRHARAAGASGRRHASRQLPVAAAVGLARGRRPARLVARRGGVQVYVEDHLIEHGREAFVKFANRFLDLCALDEASHLHKESQPFLTASECRKAVSLHDIERNPSSCRIRHAFDKQSLVVACPIVSQWRCWNWVDIKGTGGFYQNVLPLISCREEFLPPRRRRRRRIVGHATAPNMVGLT